eukprot:jgi/Botrbrau1/18284/Bobra.0179s0015.2
MTVQLAQPASVWTHKKLHSSSRFWPLCRPCSSKMTRQWQECGLRRDGKPHLTRRPAAVEEQVEAEADLNRSFVGAEEPLRSQMDKSGSGSISLVSPTWLVQLGQLWGGKSDTPVANAKLEEIQELLGGALFKALYKWMLESGPVYLLPTGPISSFLVISDPKAAKHVLQRTDNPSNNVYEKGLVREVSEFLFGTGFAVSGGEQWRVRRKAVGPSLHRAYLDTMISRVFAPSASHLNTKLEKAAASGGAIDMEACFSQLTLDVIGKAVFNYEFDALDTNSPIIQAVYTALKETETRATDLLPFWKLSFLKYFVPRFQKVDAAVTLIRNTTEELIAQCKQMVSAEEEAAFAAGGEEYMNEADPSVLRFLIASREEVTAEQLRDDLLSMLVAGHETTASVLTWTLYLLVLNPPQMAKAVEEINSVMGEREVPTLADYAQLKYVLRCVNESMRLYPHPPVLLRRALREDVLPGNYKVLPKQDVMISVYNIHHSPTVWESPDDFIPERFDLSAPAPTELNTDFRCVCLCASSRGLQTHCWSP